MKAAPTFLVSLALTGVSGAVLGCPTGPDDAPTQGLVLADFEAALPTEALLALSIPGTDTPLKRRLDPRRDTRQGALVGQVSEHYEFTRSTVVAVNGGLVAIIASLRWVVENVPPVAVTPDSAVWAGPDGDRMVVLQIERKPDGHFEYVSAWRPVDEPEADWIPTVGGTWTPAAETRGQGAVWLKLDNDADPKTVGTILALYSTVGPERSVSVQYYQYSQDADVTPPYDAAYHYQEAEDHSGVFVYALKGVDVDNGAPGREAKEDSAVISRWMADGAGRSDWYVTGGDVAAQDYEWARSSQCWAAGTWVTEYESLWVKLFGAAEPMLAKAEGTWEACVYPLPGVPVFPDPIAEPADPLPPAATEP